MKSFRIKNFTLCIFIFTSVLFTSKNYSQVKENVNFNAGVEAVDVNNMPLAFKYFLAAAKENHVDSQYNVGVMYEQGIGVGKNEKEALGWYKKAGMQGNAAAQFNLGVLYENGLGTEVDFAKANEWYRKASVQNDAMAIGNLGMLYIRGDGVKENKIAGVALLLMSTSQDPSPENQARKNISGIRGLTAEMIGEAQVLSQEFSSSKNFLVMLDQYLKK